MDCGRKMMVFLFLYSVVELGNAAVVDNCPISADEREMRIKEFFRKDPAVCNHDEIYHCIPLLDDTSFNGFYEGCMEDTVIDKDGCIDVANVTGTIFFNEEQTPCNISCCPLPGTNYNSSELYKYPACYQNVSSRSSYSCPVVSTPTTKILHQSTTAETTAETTLIDNTSPTGLFTGINSTVTPSPKNTGIIIGVILVIIVTVVIPICCWRIEWCKNKRRNLQRHLCKDPLPTDTDEALQEKFLPTSQDAIKLELLPASAPSQQPEQLPASVPSQQPEQLPASAPSQQQGQLPASAPSQQPGQLPASVPNSPPAQEPSSAHYQQPGQLPASAPSPQPGQLPASVSNSPAAQEPSSAHYQQPGQLSASAPGQQPGQLPASTQIQLPGQIPATVPSSQPDLEQGLSSAIDKQGTLSIPDTQMQAGDTDKRYVRIGKCYRLVRNLEGSSECQWYRDGIPVTESIRNNGEFSQLTITVSSFSTTYQSKVNDVSVHHILIDADDVDGEEEDENVNSSGPQDHTDSRADDDRETTIRKTVVQETPGPGTSSRNKHHSKTGTTPMASRPDERLTCVIKREEEDEFLRTVKEVVRILMGMNDKASLEDNDIKKSVRKITIQCCDTLSDIKDKLFKVSCLTDELNHLLNNPSMRSTRQNKNTIDLLKSKASCCVEEFEKCVSNLRKVINFIQDEGNTTDFVKQQLDCLLDLLHCLLKACRRIYDTLSEITTKIDIKLLKTTQDMENACTTREYIQRIRQTVDNISDLANNFLSLYDTDINKDVEKLTMPHLHYTMRMQHEQREDNMSRDHDANEARRGLLEHRDKP